MSSLTTHEAASICKNTNGEKKIWDYFIRQKLFRSSKKLKAKSAERKKITYTGSIKSNCSKCALDMTDSHFAIKVVSGNSIQKWDYEAVHDEIAAGPVLFKRRKRK